MPEDAGGLAGCDSKNHVKWGAWWERASLKCPQIPKRTKKSGASHSKLTESQTVWTGISAKGYSQLRGQLGARGSAQPGNPGPTLPNSKHSATGHVVASSLQIIGKVVTDARKHRTEQPYSTAVLKKTVKGVLDEHCSRSHLITVLY